MYDVRGKREDGRWKMEELGILDRHELNFDASSAKEVNAIGQAILTTIYNAFDASLYDELGTFYAWRVCNIECAAIAVVAASGNLGDGIGFGMKHVGFCYAIFFADVLKAAWRAIVSVADNHLVLHDEGTYLTTLAVAVLAPYLCHSQVTKVEGMLFLRVFHLFVCRCV